MALPHPTNDGYQKGFGTTVRKNPNSNKRPRNSAMFFGSLRNKVLQCKQRMLKNTI